MDNDNIPVWKLLEEIYDIQQADERKPTVAALVWLAGVIVIVVFLILVLAFCVVPKADAKVQNEYECTLLWVIEDCHYCNAYPPGYGDYFLYLCQNTVDPTDTYFESNCGYTSSIRSDLSFLPLVTKQDTILSTPPIGD